MMAWLLWWATTLTAMAGSTDICVELLTNFNDADYIGPVEAGDWWENNQARPARGVLLKVTDDLGPTFHDAADNGCVTVGTTQTNPAHAVFAVEVSSHATVDGITVHATDGVSADPDSDPENNSSNWPGSLATTTFQVPYAATSATLTVSSGDQRWNLLALGVWAMYRNTFNLGTFSTRDCCLDTTSSDYDELDGTCTGDPTAQYANSWSSFQGADRIEMYSDGSGNSRRVFYRNGWKDEPAVGVSSPLRFLIAHELGHVIVEKRMGAYTSRSDQADHDNDQDHCIGDYVPEELEWPAGDLDPAAETPWPKGAFTKEYQSMAAREGWATFFAVWLFNSRQHTDGQMDWWMIHDLDRDGSVDNNYGDPDTTDTAPSPYNQHDMGDGIVDMGINPVKVTPKGRLALGAIAKGWDWLEHLVVGADAPGGNSTLGCVGDLANRGTEYDWARFFWDMTLTAGGDIDPEDLADLYVDMCPTNWQNAGDPDTSDTGAPAEPWPIYRLELSAIHQGTAVESEWSVRKVWGQDH